MACPRIFKILGLTMPTTTIYTHIDCLAHDPGEGHPESPQRLRDICSNLEQHFPKIGTDVIWKDAPMGSEDQVLYCHTPKYLAHLKSLTAQMTPTSPSRSLDVDTRISAGSLTAALRGVGAVCAAVDDVHAGRTKNAFCATRPPGHHALAASSMGFCLFGNVAIGAFHTLTKPDINRVAIIDFDVHHGNGTQELVEHDPRILFFSLHQSPLWPFQGPREERGAADNIRNFPVPEKSDPAIYRQIFTDELLPELNSFKPDFILISAGFDGHRDDPPPSQLFNDPAGRQLLTENDFDWMTNQLMDVAGRHGHDRIVSVLEGGYNTRVLANCCMTHVKTLSGN